MKLFLQKNAKFSSAGGSAPRPPCLRRLGALPPNPQPPAAGGFAPRPPLASGGWGLRPQTPQTAPPIANFWLRACSLPIIVRFLSRDVRNSLYSNRKLLREANLKKFFVQGTTEIYLNENLTRTRKNLLWKAKQRAKANGYKYVWTNNGRINVRLSKGNEVILISNEEDLDLIKSN